MKRRFLLVRTILLVTGLSALMAWALSASPRSGGLAARSGLSSHAPAAPSWPAPRPYGAEVIWPSAIGEIASLKNVKPVEPLIPAIAKECDENTRLPKAPLGLQRTEIDRAVQSLVLGPHMPNPIANFDGLALADQITPLLPPDTNGDIGYDPATGKHYYFQWVNVAYAAWDVTNPAAPIVVVPTTQGHALWAAALPGSTCANTNDGDPIALFDEQAQRWFISQFSVSSPFHQCVAVSKTPDPAGAWWVYDYAYRDGTTYFNDYPHFGVWPDATYNAYFMTMHQFHPATEAWLGQSASAFDRAKLLSGTAAPMVLFDLYSVNANFGGMLAADLDGPPPPAGTPGFFFEVDDANYIGPSDAMRIWEFKPNWTTPASSTFGLNGQANYTLTVAGFNLLSCSLCIPQSGTTQKLDAIGDRLMHRVAFRVHHGTLQSAVLNHTVDAGSTRASVRWYEVQRDPATGVWTIIQQNTYAPSDGMHRWMGSIAMDRSGNIALGYSASDSSSNPSIRYAGRLSGDPLNTLSQAEVTMTVSAGAQTSYKGRWGDYSMMGVDPQDGCTFWYTQEYNGTTANVTWKTRIGSFKFPACAGGLLTGTVTNANTGAPVSGTSVVASSTTGDNFVAVTNASGQYQTDIAAGTYTVTASALGYAPSATTGLSITASSTTTLNFALTPLPQADLALVKSASIGTIYVGDPLTYTLLVTNHGPDGITTTITLTDTLPAGFNLINATGSGWSCGGASTVVCTRTGLSNGTSTSATLAVSASTQIGTYTNTASVSSVLADLNGANNTAQVATSIVPTPLYLPLILK